MLQEFTNINTFESILCIKKYISLLVISIDTQWRKVCNIFCYCYIYYDNNISWYFGALVFIRKILVHVSPYEELSLPLISKSGEVSLEGTRVGHKLQYGTHRFYGGKNWVFVSFFTIIITLSKSTTQPPPPDKRMGWL